MQKGCLITYESLAQIIKYNILEETHPNSLEMTDWLMGLREICMFHLNWQTK